MRIAPCADLRPGALRLALREAKRGLPALHQAQRVQLERAARRAHHHAARLAVRADAGHREQRVAAAAGPGAAPAPRSGPGALTYTSARMVCSSHSRSELPEALHHDRHADHGGERHAERGDRHPGAAEGAGHVAQRQPRHRAGTAGQARNEPCQPRRGRRRHGGHGEQQQEERHEAGEETARREHDEGRGGEREQQACENEPAREPLRTLFEHRARQPELRGARGHLQRRDERGQRARCRRLRPAPSRASRPAASPHSPPRRSTGR